MKSRFLVILALVLLASPAQAIILGGILINNRPPAEDLLGGFARTQLVCYLFLPVCLLGEKSDQPLLGSFTREDLINNGYTDAQVDQILKDQELLIAYLQKYNLKIDVTEPGDMADFRYYVHSLIPEISDAYFDLLEEYLEK